MYKDMEAWNSTSISGTVARLVWFGMEGRWAWRNEAGWVGGSQITGSPTGHPKEPGLYSVNDKEMLKVFTQGIGIIILGGGACPIFIVISNLNAGTAWKSLEEDETKARKIIVIGQMKDKIL